jgi:hypothetical protein
LANRCSSRLGLVDPLESWELENLRRSIVMIRAGEPATALDRDRALKFLAELQRLERRDRRVSELVAELRAVLDED